MFDKRHAGKWGQRWVRFFTGRTDRPTNDEIMDAYLTASFVTRRLETCKEYLENYGKRYSERYAEVIRLIDEVLQALRNDHGGAPPEAVLSLWLDKREAHIRDHRIFAPDQKEKEAMITIWERWNNEEKIKEQFWALAIDNPVTDDLLAQLLHYPSAECSLIQCLSDWLEKRKAGQIY
ncbi:hypothetical protein FQN50_009895 [Emmonsiellopsis sp. PD_5]|nr:hypothetical protein FQN50_009895 [Emmonsiellopsis sp. PD_5]